MHPARWGVNSIVANFMSLSTLRGRTSLVTGTDDFPEFRELGTTLLLSNTLANPLYPLAPVVQYVDIQDGTAVLHCVGSTEPGTVLCSDASVTILRQVERDGRVNISFVMFSETAQTVDDVAQAIFTAGLRPVVIIDIYSSYPPRVSYRSIVLGALTSTDLTVVNVSYIFASIQSNYSLLNGTASVIPLLRPLPPNLRDETYNGTQAFLLNEALKAQRTNPVIGYTTGMPVVRTSTYRPCFAGECPAGSLVADAMRWWLDTDFAVTPSGGIRGNGFPKGPVNVSNMFELLPFPNTVCSGSLLGLSILKVMNFSLIRSTVPSVDWSATGDRLLQISGLRVTYNSNASRAEERLVCLSK